MSEPIMKIWDENRNAGLAQLLADIDDVVTMRSFLRDVMTEKEITEIAARLQAAAMLKAGRTYVEIVAQTGLSSRTVARISEWLKDGAEGYSTALELAKTHHIHLLPARD
jgi:TrpR-related protein YerC/YecD